MIENIVFDMGEVLISWYPKLHTARFHLPADDENLLIQEVVENVEWRKLDRGTISEEEAVRSMCRRLPEHLHVYAEELVLSWWKHPLTPVKGMAELVSELKGNGYGIYLLSNASLKLRTYFKRIPGSEFFDGLFVSAEHKLLKPQHEIFEEFLSTFSLKPETCFFIDDMSGNVEGAECVGIRGTVFHGDISRLRRELRNAGVVCTEA